MKHFIVIVGVLALLAICQAQSDDSENSTVASSDEDDGANSSAPPPPPQPSRPRPGPGRPGHGNRPGPGQGPIISAGHPRPDQPQQNPQSQAADSEEAGSRPSSHRRFPSRIPVFFDSGRFNNFGQNNVFGQRRTTTTPAPADFDY